VLTSPADHVEINAQLGGLLLPGRAFLHHYDETAERRVKIANAIATLPIHGAILGLVETTDQAQERARAKLMAWLLSRLQHAENVRHVMIERREGGDKHDRRRRRRCGSRTLPLGATSATNITRTTYPGRFSASRILSTSC
jgi:hypothetical protein